MSFLGLTRRGSRAARCGTRITPMYMDEFLGDKSKLMSINGVPFTFNNLSNKAVNSSVGEGSLEDVWYSFDDVADGL